MFKLSKCKSLACFGNCLPIKDMGEAIHIQNVRIYEDKF